MFPNLECPVEGIGRVLADTSVQLQWEILASRLGLTCAERVWLCLIKRYHNCSTGDIITRVIKTWKSRYPSQAYLGVLLYHIVVVMECRDVYPALKVYFEPRMKKANSLPHQEIMSLSLSIRDLEKQQLINTGNFVIRISICYFQLKLFDTKHNSLQIFNR